MSAKHLVLILVLAASRHHRGLLRCRHPAPEEAQPVAEGEIPAS